MINNGETISFKPSELQGFLVNLNRIREQEYFPESDRSTKDLQRLQGVIRQFFVGEGELYPLPDEQKPLTNESHTRIQIPISEVVTFLSRADEAESGELLSRLLQDVKNQVSILVMHFKYVAELMSSSSPRVFDPEKSVQKITVALPLFESIKQLRAALLAHNLGDRPINNSEISSKTLIGGVQEIEAVVIGALRTIKEVVTTERCRQLFASTKVSEVLEPLLSSDDSSTHTT